MLNKTFLKEVAALEKAGKSASWAFIMYGESWRVNTENIKAKQVKEQLCELGELVDTTKRETDWTFARDWHSNPDPTHAQPSDKSFGYLFKRVENGRTFYRVVPVKDIVGQERDLVAWWGDQAIRETLEARIQAKVTSTKAAAEEEADRLEQRLVKTIREMTNDLVSGLGNELFLEPKVAIEYKTVVSADRSDVDVEVIMREPRCEITFSYEQYQQLLEVVMSYKDLTERGLVA